MASAYVLDAVAGLFCLLDVGSSSLPPSHSLVHIFSVTGTCTSKTALMLVISPLKATARLLVSTQQGMKKWVDPEEGPIRFKLGIENLVEEDLVLD